MRFIADDGRTIGENNGQVLTKTDELVEPVPPARLYQHFQEKERYLHQVNHEVKNKPFSSELFSDAHKIGQHDLPTFPVKQIEISPAGGPKCFISGFSLQVYGMKISINTKRSVFA